MESLDRPVETSLGPLFFFFNEILSKVCVCVRECTHALMLHVISIQNGQKRTGRTTWSSWRLEGDARQKAEELRPLTWPGMGAGGSLPSSWHTTGLLGITAKKAALWVRLGAGLLLGLFEGDRQTGKLCPLILKPFFFFPKVRNVEASLTWPQLQRKVSS